MRKLSVSVPDDIERALREQAAAEHTTVSAVLTQYIQRQLELEHRLHVAAQMLADAVAEHGPVTAQEHAEGLASLQALNAFEARKWAQAS